MHSRKYNIDINIFSVAKRMPGNIDFGRALHVRFCSVITLLRVQTKRRDCALENTRSVGRVTSHRPRDRETRRARESV